MKHNHKHSYNCEHESVKFCKICKVVHCLSCNQEWKTYLTNTYPWYFGNNDTYTQPYTLTSGLAQKSGYIQTLNDNTLNDGHITACNHLS